MSVWEKKRQEREQQKNALFGNQSQIQNPVIFQGAGQQMSAAALGISAVQKPVSDQSAAVLLQAGIIPPPTNQNRPSSGWQSNQSQQNQYQSQTSFQQQNNGFPAPQAQQRNATPQPPLQQQYEQKLPVNQRDEEKQRYEQSKQQLTFDSYQPKKQQITQGDPELFDRHQQSLSKKKPSEMTDKEYEEFEKRQIKSQQLRLLKSVVWNPKASSFDKREVEELCKIDSEFKKQYEAEMAIKKKQDDEAAAQAREREEERLKAERAEQVERQEKEALAAKQRQEQQKQPSSPNVNRQSNIGNPEQPRQELQESQFGQNSQLTGSQVGQSIYNQDQMYGSRAPFGVPNMQFPRNPMFPEQMGDYGHIPYGQPYGQMYGNQGFPGPAQGRQYYQSANAPSEPGVAQLQDELKMLRERLRRAELGLQTQEKTINELKYQLQQEKDARLEAEKALVAAQRDLQKLDGNFQMSLKQQQPQQQQQQQYQQPQTSSWNPQSQQQPQSANQWAHQQSQREAAELVNNILANNIEGKNVQFPPSVQNPQAPVYSTYTKQSSRPGSGQPPGVLNKIQGSPQNQVDKILNNANEIIDQYQVSAQTLARAQDSEFARARQQLYQQNQWKSSDILPNRSPGMMRTIQADSSLIDNMNTVQREQYEKEKSNRELNSLLNEDPNYNTITMQRPPDDVPPSLLESLDVNKGMRPPQFGADGQNQVQNYYTAADIAKKFGQAK